MSMSFRTSNSGAFRSLHCLIYKVLAPTAEAVRNSSILAQPVAFVKLFFQLFSKFFELSSSSEGFRADSFDRLPHLSQLVNTFFLLFRSFLLPSGPLLDRRRTACIIYHPSSPLSTPFSPFFPASPAFVKFRHFPPRQPAALYTLCPAIIPHTALLP